LSDEATAGSPDPSAYAAPFAAIPAKMRSANFQGLVFEGLIFGDLIFSGLIFT
jgi:hypothetical protein